MAKITISEETCKGCALCVTACPLKIVQLARDHINSKGYHPAICVDPAKCTGCAGCARMCPDMAITVER